MTCSATSCDEPAKFKGMCRKHYGRAHSKAYAAANPEKRAATLAAFAEKNPDYYYGKNIKRRYGVDLAWYEQQLSQQQGCCKACDRPLSKRGSKTLKQRSPVIDHCHATGKVRGVICHACNIALGAVEDQTHVLHNLVAYLEKSRG